MLIPLGILDFAAGVQPVSAYDLLESEVLTGSQSSITFSSLGSYSAYQHLQLRITARGNPGIGFTELNLQFNNDTSSSYAFHRLRANGSVVEATGATTQSDMNFGYLGGNEGSSIFSQVVADILDFSSSNKTTTVRSISAFDDDEMALFSGGYFSTDPITEIDIIPDAGSDFLTGSRFSIYGLRSVTT